MRDQNKMTIREMLAWYVSPRQVCNHCTLAFWTWTPWRRWYCNHPNCQRAGRNLSYEVREEY